MNKFKLIQLLNKLELAVGETVMAKKVKENINELILDVKNEAINYTHSCKSDSEQLKIDKYNEPLTGKKGTDISSSVGDSLDDF